MFDRRFLVPLALLLLTGCTLIPDYSRPAPPVPAGWATEGSALEAKGAEVAMPALPWKELFVDERLRKVVELALENNRDLRIAALNVDRARGYYRVQRSELFPALGVQATGEKTRIPEKMNDSGNASYSEQYSIAFGIASWEIDFFGRIRSLEEKALEQYLATEQAEVAARTALVAGTAQAWLALAADREALELTRATLDGQLRSADLIRKSREAGIVSDLDLRQAESQADLSRADVARLTGQAATDRNFLDLLVGAPVAAELLPDRLSAVTEQRHLAPGLSSELLQNRPDILMAEHALKAANANIGALRAAFFPRISLTAGIGTLSPDLSGLFDSGTRTWSIAPQILAPLYASGAMRANLAAGKAEHAIAIAQYEKAIQTAFREVADALVRRETLAAQRDAQESLVRSLDDVFRLSKARYENGIDGYLGVIVAERSLLAARQGLVGVRFAEEANLITLYKVLGGGSR
jgi:multidrug efflux system outer membrane protein